VLVLLRPVELGLRRPKGDETIALEEARLRLGTITEEARGGEHDVAGVLDLTHKWTLSVIMDV